MSKAPGSPCIAERPGHRRKQQPPHSCGHVQLYTFLPLLPGPQVTKIVNFLHTTKRPIKPDDLAL